MRILKHLTTWLLLLTVFLASGVVSGKLASGPQNLGWAGHQAKTTSNPLWHQAKIDYSYGEASGSSVATKSTSKEITKSSRKRVKRLIKNLSDNSRQNNGLSQEKTDQLRRIVEKAGGKLRNDGATGVKGSSAGKPHVQTEGLGKSIDSRHIWTQGGVQ